MCNNKYQPAGVTIAATWLRDASSRKSLIGLHALRTGKYDFFNKLRVAIKVIKAIQTFGDQDKEKTQSLPSV